MMQMPRGLSLEYRILQNPPMYHQRNTGASLGLSLEYRILQNPPMYYQRNTGYFRTLPCIIRRIQNTYTNLTQYFTIQEQYMYSHPPYIECYARFITVSVHSLSNLNCRGYCRFPMPKLFTCVIQLYLSPYLKKKLRF